jgi:heat shock protein HslJ
MGGRGNGKGVLPALVLAAMAGCSGLPFADADGEKALRASPWEWIAGGTAAMPRVVARPDRYTLEFQPQYRVAVRADCNRGIGPWRLDGGKVSIGPLTISKRLCGADSRGREFQAGLEATHRWYLRDGALFLELPHDRGVFRLAAQAPKAPQAPEAQEAQETAP